MRIAIAILVAAASGVGCTVGTQQRSDGELDAEVLELLADYRSLPAINARPYRSTLGPFDVNWYAAGDLAAYARIHPERVDSGVRVAPGTTIVREVLDGAGRVSKLTVMCKGPPGFDPSLGDWWFAVTDPRGVPLAEDGELMIGRLTQCHECHRDRPRDDFLFGVPAAAE